MTGSWNVEVNTNGLPQKVASAMSTLAEQLIGVEYKMIAYLGSQVVNGTNHAVLAEQTILTGKDSKNIVILIFNEKPSDTEATLVSIDRVLESGLPLGGTEIDVKLAENMSEDIKTLWHDAFEGWVGGRYYPIALLGTKMANGINYIFAGLITAMGPNDTNDLILVAINSLTKRVSMGDLLADKVDHTLGYAFSW